MRFWSTIKSNLDIKIVLVALLYYLSARLGLFMAFEGITTPVWPSSGIAFALLLLLGRRTWPGITIGALIANILVFWNTHAGNASIIISTSTLVAAGNTLEAIVGCFLFKKVIDEKNPFTNINSTFKFLFIALTISLISSTIGTASQYFNQIINYDALTLNWFTWYVGDLVGVLIFTPLFLAWASKFKFDFSKSKILESLVFVVSLVLVIYLIQLDYVATTLQRAFPFLVMPFLLWLAFRFNLQTAMTGILIASAIAIIFTINNQGPFVLENSNSSLILLQIFLGVITVTTIIMSATVKERTEAQKTIEKFNENLEARIQERTKELNDEIQNRKKAQEKIKVSNRKLKKTNTELDSFVYSVSHDLRAPIASVKGLINLAKMEPDQNMIQDYLQMIDKSMDQQEDFIKEILDLSRNSRLNLEKEEISFKKIINDIFNQLKYDNSTDKVKKKVKISAKHPFISDQRRLKVIFNNLISNAIRYSNGKQPEVSIDISVKDAKAKINVKDNGIGIEKEHLDKVFNMFYRATEQNTGSGLGLYIVKETVEKLNGSIHLESEPGKGTKVTLEIPSLN